jgi:hypothetical protein
MSAFGPKANLDEPRIVRVDPEAEKQPQQSATNATEIK